jgi:hypothetical protein
LSEPDAAPQYRTGALWGVLGVLLVLGTVGAAGVAYGASILLSDGSWAVALVGIGGGGVVAGISFLLMVGILYRVDRYRGVLHREVPLFE